MKYQVDYAGVGGDGIDQFIIVDSISLDEYTDAMGDHLCFPTEAEAWEYIDNLNEKEYNV